MSRQSTTLPLAVTAGEPAGIGPDLCLALANTPLASGLVVIGDPAVLNARAAMLGVDIVLRQFPQQTWRRNGDLAVLPGSLPNPDVCGKPDPANARALLSGLEVAVAGCRDGTFAGIVTAPLQKSVINDAGIPFTGHTEYLAKLTSVDTPVMLLVAGELRVALASTHMPLSAVPAYLTQERLSAVLDVLHKDLRKQFRLPDPEIIVCGLNPHAGEGGHLGFEDRDIIAPVVATARASGMRVRGPLPADTAFTPAAGKADAILAMYHDQGLPVVKYAGFGNAVNVTLGLPVIRTSVDHGTALDLAGTGKAEAGSMIAAVELAAELAAR
ncbi:MAG: 4-hydroxythreonine-4-phosphate dehydrogenase PdxA [Woeseia sp.]